MQDDLGVANRVGLADFQRGNKRRGDLRALEALDSPALLADKMGMLMHARLFRSAGGVAPGAILPADPVDELLADKGVEGSIHRDGIGPRGHCFQNPRRRQRLGAGDQQIQHPHAHRRAPQPALTQKILTARSIAHIRILPGMS